jgi:hypothetical protein
MSELKDIQAMTPQPALLKQETTLRRTSGGVAWVLAALLSLALLACGLAAPAEAASRIKDLVDFEGVRDNQLVGYGLVVGLNKTGSRTAASPSRACSRC